MQILELPERDLKKELKIYALEYVKKNSYYKSRKIVIDFLMIYLNLTPKSKRYKELMGKIQNDLWLITHKLLKMGIITYYNRQFYKINKDIKDFNEELEIIKNSINKKGEKRKKKKIKPVTGFKPLVEKKERRGCKKKRLKITDDEIKELYNKKIGVPTISEIAGCNDSTIYRRLRGERKNYWNKQLKITNDKIKELYNKKVGVSKISKLAECCDSTIRNRLKKMGVKTSRLNGYNEDEFIQFLNRVYLKNA